METLEPMNLIADTDAIFLEIELKPHETVLANTVKVFNKLCTKFYPYILDDNYLGLYTKSEADGLGVSLTQWKSFLLDSRISAWYTEESNLALQAKKQQLIKGVGTNNSTASVQALSAIFKYEQDNASEIEDNKVFIFSFVPLTSEESKLSNAHVLKAIPDSLRGAITDTSKRNKEFK